MSSSRIFPGMTLTLQTVVKQGGTATNAADITFKWLMGYNNKINSVTPVNTGTGTYKATFTLPQDECGLLRYRWDTEGDLDFVEEGAFMVDPTSFATVNTKDYL